MTLPLELTLIQHGAGSLETVHRLTPFGRVPLKLVMREHHPASFVTVEFHEAPPLESSGEAIKLAPPEVPLHDLLGERLAIKNAERPSRRQPLDDAPVLEHVEDGVERLGEVHLAISFGGPRCGGERLDLHCDGVASGKEGSRRIVGAVGSQRA